MKILLAVICCYLCAPASAQEKVLTSLEDEEKIVLRDNTFIDINVTRRGITVDEKVSKVYAFQSDVNRNLGSESISYNSFASIEEIDAFTLDPWSRRKTSVEKFESADVLIQGIFYSDQQEKNFVFPNVKKGVEGHLNYTKRIRDPHFISPFIPSPRYHTKEAVLTVSFPESVEVDYRTFNVDSSTMKFSERMEGDKRIIEWRFKNLGKLSRNTDFSPLYYIPQIIVYIDNYWLKNENVKVLSSTEDLYAWYRDLTKSINTTDQESLKARTAQVINSAQSDKEKVERIFYHVQNEINYIAFEDGLNGFVPRDAAVVAKNKYGDCKDMANVLNEMLKYAGINAGLTWIGTRKKPYSYDELSTPFTDNHMITTAFVDGEYVFLDATAKYLMYGIPSPFVQGKQALISKGAKQFELFKIPEIEAQKNRMSLVSDLVINETGKLVGTHKVHLDGYHKLELLHKLDNKSDNDKDFLRNTLEHGHRTTGFSDIIYTNNTLNAQPLGISYTTETSSAIRKIGDDLYVKPLLDTYLQEDLVQDEELKFDKKIDFKTLRSHKTLVHIPEGYVLKMLPPNKEVTNASHGFDISFEMVDDRTIAIEHTIEVNTLQVTPKNLLEWNDFIKQLSKATNTSLVFKKQL